MPGARSTISALLSVGRISAIRGSSRWVTNSPAASTTIQVRSRSKPVSISRASSNLDPGAGLHRVDEERSDSHGHIAHGSVSTREKRRIVPHRRRRCRAVDPYNPRMNAFDVQVVGAGIVGKCLALGLARQGLDVALLERSGRSRRRRDVRAYALNAVSVELLRGLKVWEALPSHAATPVYEMQVQGDSGDSALEFSAWEQRVGELAWITDAALLEQALDEALRYAPRVKTGPTAGEASLTAYCEGASSSSRAALGIEFEQRDYGQLAIAARLVSGQGHLGVARQWFRAPDVLALLPFDTPQPGSSLALVWSMPTPRAQALMDAPASEFERALAEATDGAAGELKLASARAAWPLRLGRAERWAGPGWVLLGDAAHVVHPLAGQGLNLGLADVAALVDVVAARESWRSLGDERLLRRYVSARATPTWAMGEVTDGLVRLFSHESPALRELRNRGLNLVNRLTPVKRWLTSQALGS